MYFATTAPTTFEHLRHTLVFITIIPKNHRTRFEMTELGRNMFEITEICVRVYSARCLCCLRAAYANPAYVHTILMSLI